MTQRERARKRFMDRVLEITKAVADDDPRACMAWIRSLTIEQGGGEDAARLATAVCGKLHLLAEAYNLPVG